MTCNAQAAYHHASVLNDDDDDDDDDDADIDRVCADHIGIKIACVVCVTGLYFFFTWSTFWVWIFVLHSSL